MDKTAVEEYKNLSTTTINEMNNTIENKGSNYASMSSPPLFTGGMDKLNAFLESSIIYPNEAVDNDIQGIVKVNFTVEKDGSCLLYTSILK